MQTTRQQLHTIGRHDRNDSEKKGSGRDNKGHGAEAPIESVTRDSGSVHNLDLWIVDQQRAGHMSDTVSISRTLSIGPSCCKASSGQVARAPVPHDQDVLRRDDQRYQTVTTSDAMEGLTAQRSRRHSLAGTVLPRTGPH